MARTQRNHTSRSRHIRQRNAVRRVVLEAFDRLDIGDVRRIDGKTPFNARQLPHEFDEDVQIADVFVVSIPSTTFDDLSVTVGTITADTAVGIGLSAELRIMPPMLRPGFKHVLELLDDVNNRSMVQPVTFGLNDSLMLCAGSVVELELNADPTAMVVGVLTRFVSVIDAVSPELNREIFASFAEFHVPIIFEFPTSTVESSDVRGE